jgi:hypothetical protein
MVSGGGEVVDRAGPIRRRAALVRVCAVHKAMVAFAVGAADGDARCIFSNLAKDAQQLRRSMLI